MSGSSVVKYHRCPFISIYKLSAGQPAEKSNLLFRSSRQLIEWNGNSAKSPRLDRQPVLWRSLRW